MAHGYIDSSGNITIYETYTVPDGQFEAIFLLIINLVVLLLIAMPLSLIWNFLGISLEYAHIISVSTLFLVSDTYKALARPLVCTFLALMKTILTFLLAIGFLVGLIWVIRFLFGWL